MPWSLGRAAPRWGPPPGATQWERVGGSPATARATCSREPGNTRTSRPVTAPAVPPTGRAHLEARGQRNRMKPPAGDKGQPRPGTEAKRTALGGQTGPQGHLPSPLPIRAKHTCNQQSRLVLPLGARRASRAGTPSVQHSIASGLARGRCSPGVFSGCRPAVGPPRCSPHPSSHHLWSPLWCLSCPTPAPPD